MRIAIDARCLQDHFPGIGRYTYNLCRTLPLVGGEHDFIILYDSRARNTRFPLDSLIALPNVRMLPVSVGVFSPWSQVRLPLLLREERIDLFHSPYYLRPYVTFAPAVVTLHDLIPLVLREHGVSTLLRQVFKITTRATIWTATRLIAVSEASRQDFCTHFGVPEHRIKVVHHGVDERFCPRAEEEVVQIRRQFGLPSEFLLYSGIDKPHKNLARLVEAFGRLERSDLTLALAGPQSARRSAAREVADRLNLGERVRFLGAVDDDSLPGLYAAAAALVLPSLYEGFGLPVLEAMACGTPVVCSNTSSLPEVVGDAAILVDPRDVDAWSEAIARVLASETLRTELRRKGLARAAQFTWERSARATLAVYAEAVVN
ncbi:MAG: glycosyltransferase family 4 protein [Chloroflexota bacterium]